MEEELRQLGFTDKEIKVYIACLKLGSALVNDIAKKAGTHRTYTYEVLQSLKEKGLVGYVIKSGKQYFEASKPDRLLFMLEEKKAITQSILPQLNNIYKSIVEKPKIEFYDGIEGLKTVLDDIILSKKNILVYCSTRKQAILLNYYFPNYVKRRIKAGIKIKVLTERSPEALELFNKNKEELRKMKFLPESFEPPTATNIYGNKVAILSLEKEPIGVIIENEDIAKTQRLVFELLWNMAETK